MPSFRVKLGANVVNCVDVPLNSTHSLSRDLRFYCASVSKTRNDAHTFLLCVVNMKFSRDEAMSYVG